MTTTIISKKGTIVKIKPTKIQDRLINFLETNHLYNAKKLSKQEAKFYFDILNIFNP